MSFFFKNMLLVVSARPVVFFLRLRLFCAFTPFNAPPTGPNHDPFDLPKIACVRLAGAKRNTNFTDSSLAVLKTQSNA